MMKKNYYFILDSQLDRLHKEQIDRGKQSLINFSLIFGGLAAGVYYIVELLC